MEHSSLGCVEILSIEQTVGASWTADSAPPKFGLESDANLDVASTACPLVQLFHRFLHDIESIKLTESSII